MVWRQPEIQESPSSFGGQFRLQGVRAVSDEFPQQLMESISIRNPSPLRTAFGDELEKQPAICFLRWNNNGAIMDQGSLLEKEQVSLSNTAWSLGNNRVEPIQVPANSTLWLSTIITSLPPTPLSPDDWRARKHYLNRELDSKPQRMEPAELYVLMSVYITLLPSDWLQFDWEILERCDTDIVSWGIKHTYCSYFVYAWAYKMEAHWCMRRVGFN